MKKDDIERFRQRLIALRDFHLKKKEHIEGECLHKQMRNQAGDLSGYPIHMADVSGDIHEQEKEISLVKNISNIVFEIEEALMRIENKTYGICEKCKGEIPIERLEILPFARFCIKCQEPSSRTLLGDKK